jgi:hypothetical protein
MISCSIPPRFEVNYCGNATPDLSEPVIPKGCSDKHSGLTLLG